MIIVGSFLSKRRSAKPRGVYLSKTNTYIHRVIRPKQRPKKCNKLIQLNVFVCYDLVLHCEEAKRCDS